MSDYPSHRDTNSYSSKLQVRHGSILMHRRGVPQFNYQKNEHSFSTTPAPERSGLWAFPWPYKEPFLTEWKWDAVVPKEFIIHESADEEAGEKARTYLKYDDAQPWIAERRKRKDVLPWTRFWWEGDVYARFNEQADFDSFGAVSAFSPAGGWYLLPWICMWRPCAKLRPIRRSMGMMRWKSSWPRGEVRLPAVMLILRINPLNIKEITKKWTNKIGLTLTTASIDCEPMKHLQ